LFLAAEGWSRAEGGANIKTVQDAASNATLSQKARKDGAPGGKKANTIFV
jgi:hypothetical protein